MLTYNRFIRPLPSWEKSDMKSPKIEIKPFTVEGFERAGDTAVLHVRLSRLWIWQFKLKVCWAVIRAPIREKEGRS